jgi:uncharacterized protein (DUF433 family)
MDLLCKGLIYSVNPRTEHSVPTTTHIRPAKPLTDDALRGDLIQPDHPFFGMIWINPERLSGAPCFAGTRVPVKNLFDYLESGYTLKQFVEDFDGVTQEQAVGVIEVAQSGLLAELPQL